MNYEDMKPGDLWRPWACPACQVNQMDNSTQDYVYCPCCKQKWEWTEVLPPIDG